MIVIVTAKSKKGRQVFQEKNRVVTPSIAAPGVTRHSDATGDWGSKIETKFRSFSPPVRLAESDGFLFHDNNFVATQLLCFPSHPNGVSTPPCETGNSCFVKIPVPFMDLLFAFSPSRQHLSHDGCLEVTGKIIRTILYCTVY